MVPFWMKKMLNLVGKDKLQRALVSNFLEKPYVISDHILVAEGRNPVRPLGHHTTVWIPLADRELTSEYGRSICKEVCSLYKDNLSSEWNAMELYIGGFDETGAFDKAYRLTIFNEEVEEILALLDHGLPGKLFSRDVGALFYPNVNVKLINQTQ